MSTVREILRAKGSHVETVPAQMSLLEAVKVMNLHRIGCVVVTDAEQHVCGLLSERDVMILAAEDPTGLAQLSVGEAMTTEVLVCHHEDPIDSVRATMRSKWIRPSCLRTLTWK